MEMIETTLAFVRQNQESLTVGGLAAAVLFLSWGVRRAIKSGRPDKWLSVVSVLIGFGWSAEAMWEVSTQVLHLATSFALLGFVVFESMLATAMMRAERHQKLFQHPGKYGRSVWLIAVVMGGVAALAGDTWVERALRLAIPLLVAKQWWDGLTDGGVKKPDDAITWMWNLRSILVALKLAKPGNKDLKTVDRDRHILALAKVAHRLHTTSNKWRKSYLNARLRSLSMDADDAMLDEARIRVERVWRSADRTRPLEAHEHALVLAAKADAASAQQQAEDAAAAAEAAHTELAQIREALERSTAVTGQASEQIQLLQQELQQARHDAERTVEQVRRDADLAIAQARREAQVEVDLARHEAELAVAAARTRPAVNGHNGFATVPAAGTSRASVTSLVPAPAGEQASADSVALPATAQACTEWMTLWAKVCHDMPSVAAGQPISEDTAREHFGVSVRHLRKVRNAARSGALRRKAEELGAAIPDGYDTEEAQPVNGYAHVG